MLVVLNLSSHSAFLGAVTAGHVPTWFSEAVQHVSWHEAMKSELEALERNKAWILSDLPIGKKAIGCKWVYRIKYKSTGEIERYKARLVVLGNKQVEGIDFTMTSTLVAKMGTVWGFSICCSYKRLGTLTKWMFTTLFFMTI